MVSFLQVEKKTSEAGRIIVLKDSHTLISRTCAHVTLLGKRGFADVIKLRILNGISCIIQVSLGHHHKCVYNREEGDLTSEVGDVMVDARGWSHSKTVRNQEMQSEHV